MRTTTGLALLLGLVALGCGGSTSDDLKSGSGGGSSGSGGSSSGGASSGGSSSGGTSTGGTSTGGTGVGGGSSGGSPGVGGAPGLCCNEDSECPGYTAEGYGFQCVNHVCKEPLDDGLCWSDKDCGGIPGACEGASVCPCGADCFAADSPGKCVVIDQCCQKNEDCDSAPPGGGQCVAGNCEAKPPPGQCWTDADCGPASTCGGACICPCGSVCACGGQMGSCTFKPD